MDDIPDGVSEIIGDSLMNSKAIALMPDEMNLPSFEMRREDVRDIHHRQRGVVIDSETEIEILDQPEAGELNYVLIHATGGGTELPDGEAAVDPSNIAVFLQLDGNAQGGFETDQTASGFHYKGITLSDVNTMGLPEQYGNWFVTKSTSSLYVAHYRGLRPYSHRMRLLITNTAPQGNKASVIFTGGSASNDAKTVIITDGDGNSHTMETGTAGGETIVASTSTLIGLNDANTAAKRVQALHNSLKLAVAAGNLNLDFGDFTPGTSTTLTVTQRTRGTIGNKAVTGTFGDSTAIYTVAGGTSSTANSFDGGTAEKVYIDRIEISRRRYLALHGGSNTRGPPSQEYGL